MRFQDAVRDGRAVVYAGIQADPLVARAASLLEGATGAERLLARAAMTGERLDTETWHRIFPTLFGEGVGEELSRHAEEVLGVSLEIADLGDASRSQYRGALVEELTARLLARRAGPEAPVRRERRVLFDGVRSEIHPYDVTVESTAAPEVYDCKWGARGINADVLNQLDDARKHAADEEVDLRVAIVVFDARRSCELRLDRATAQHAETWLVALESLDELGQDKP